MLVPYIVAGDPEPGYTVTMMHKLVERGANIIELGVPFSDPMAEGPVIQLAHERALVHDVTLDDVLGMVKTFREQDTTTPVVIMGYANPVLRMGYENFANKAADAGLDGLLTVDLPPEEAEELTAILAKFDINTIFLIAPTTASERIQSIVKVASGYLYYVSLKGVTGAANIDIQSVQNKLKEVKAATDLPIAVGFGIKDAASASAIAQIADGVVVGSELIRHIVEAKDSLGNDQTAQIDKASALISDMRRAMDANG